MHDKNSIAMIRTLTFVSLWIYADMEMPIQKSLLKMELYGMSVDCNGVKSLCSDISDVIRKLESAMFRLTGKHLNVTSKREVAEVLQLKNKKFCRLDLENSSNPIAKLVLDHRKLSFILSNVIQPLSSHICKNR